MKHLFASVISLTILGSAAGATQAANLLTNGDFSGGNTGFTSQYTYETFISSETEYTVTAANNLNSINSYGDWTSVATDPSGGTGNVLVANGATSPGVSVWSETVTVTQNTNYVFSFYGADVNAARVSDAVLSPIIDGTAGSSLATDGSWQFGTYIWNSGTNTSAILSLVDTNTSASWNDFAVGNLSFSSAVATPEPATWGLMGLGFAGLAFAGYRGRRSATVTA